jgi:hypothetical protein
MDGKAVNSQRGQVETRDLEKSLEGTPGREFNHGREGNLVGAAVAWRYNGDGDMCHSSSNLRTPNVVSWSAVRVAVLFDIYLS